MNTTTRLTAIGYGATVCDVDENGEARPWFVMHRCATKTHGYLCTTHGRFLANVGNLVMHVEDGQPHEIVNWCARHGMYEEADPVQIAALEGQS